MEKVNSYIQENVHSSSSNKSTMTDREILKRQQIRKNLELSHIYAGVLETRYRRTDIVWINTDKFHTPMEFSATDEP